MILLIVVTVDASGID